MFFIFFIQIEEVEPIEQEVVGVTEIENNCHLTVDDEIFLVPSQHYSGNIDDIIMEVPLKIIIKHVNKRVVSIQTVE